MSFEASIYRTLSCTSIGQLGFDYDPENMIEFFKNLQKSHSQYNRNQGLTQNESDEKVSRFATEILEKYTDQRIKEGLSDDLKSYVENAYYGTSLARFDLNEPSDVESLKDNIKFAGDRFGKSSVNSVIYGFLRTYL